MTIVRGLLVLFIVLVPQWVHAAVFYPTSFTLLNGLEVIVVPNKLAPAVSQMIWYKVGSADEVPGKTGLAHFLEHLMFRGTKDLGPGEFSKRIATQGGSDNAFTSYDFTAYYVNVAADRLPMIMKMEADRMQNLTITAEVTAPELNVVLSERQERTDNTPQGLFGERLKQMLLPKHPYGTPVIGWREEIEKLTAEDATAFYKQHYAPNNAVVIISGDVTVEGVKQLAEEIYGPIPKRDVPVRPALSPVPEPSQKRFVMKDARVEQSQMQLNIVVPSYNTQKTKEAYAYEVLSEALDSGEIGVLYRALVKEQALAAGLGVHYDGDARGDSIMTIGLSPRPGIDPEFLETALNKTLQELAQKGLDDKTIASAKSRLDRASIFARDSLMMPGYAFGMGLTTGHTVADIEAGPDRIKAVTALEVNAALRSLVSNPRQIMGLLLPDPEAPPEARKAMPPVIKNDMGIK